LFRTSLEFVSEILWKWSEGVERPSSGSLVKLVTKNGETNLVCE
jgi:dihydropteridine reductase